MTIEKPNKKQEEFFLAERRHIAYGGARGGGKSWAVRRKALLLCARYPGIRVLIVRCTYPELRENHIYPLQRELHGLAKWKESEKSFFFSNGSRIRLGYCDGDGDAARYQGQEFDVLFIDEATQLSEFCFNALRMTVRGVNRFPKRVYITCNPGGVGHEWVKRLFVDREFRPGENPEEYIFIPARAEDNSALLKADPGYIHALDALPDGLREAWRDGRWDLFAGRYFTEFSEGTHVVSPFEIPKGWRRTVTLDYGLDMLAAYWIAEDFAGRSYVYRELYKPDMLVSEAAAEILALSGGESIYQTLAPPDLWSRQRESGRSIAEIFEGEGLFLTKTGNSRVDGWLSVKEELKVDPESGRPRLVIFKTCKNLIRCLPLLQYDEKRPGDIAGEPHELTHGPDALRGYCTFRGRGGGAPPEAGVAFPWKTGGGKRGALGMGESVNII